MGTRPLFNPEDYDIDGLRRMIAFERLERITYDDLYDFFDDPGDEAEAKIIAALRDANPVETGIALIAALKDYFYIITSDDDAIERAYELHQDAYDDAAIARGECE